MEYSEYMTKAVIYCRVSTKEQVNNNSLPTQEKECRLWCERNGYAVDRVFIEAGESAKTVKNRPEFLDLLAYCRIHKKSLRVLVVHSISRFARDPADHHAIRGFLLGLGITLRSVTEPTDDTPEGRLVEDIVAGMAAYDNRSKARRTRTAMATALEAGRWTFVAPVGYLNARSRTGPSLLGDPERGPLIKQAFEAFASGCRTRHEILAQITALGLRTLKGSRLSAQTFHAVLRNPIYAGQIVVPRLNVTAVGDFAPLVSQQVFERVQALLFAKVKAVVPHLRNHPDFPLRRFVGCAACGTPLTGSWSSGRTTRYPYYHCRACKGVRVRREVLESRFLELLGRLQPNASYLRLFHEVVLDVWRGRRSEAVEIAKVATRRAEDLRRRLDRVEVAFTQTQVIDRMSYERQRDQLREDLALVEMESAEAKHDELDIEGVLAFAENVLNDATGLWVAASLDQKQRLQRVFFPEGLKFDGKAFRTAVTCLAFKQLAASECHENAVASPTGFEPVF